LCSTTFPSYRSTTPAGMVIFSRQPDVPYHAANLSRERP
jgi:hypothetical protein